jgi:hypothetical protein
MSNIHMAAAHLSFLSENIRVLAPPREDQLEADAESEQ